MIGETLGSYRIIEKIGSGGMGVVYMAEHTVLGRKAAVKLLRSDVSDELIERFFNEAKAAATLQHPGLVDVYDFGNHTNGRAFIVMEFLQGESLSERLEHEPRLPVTIACAITRSVAIALAVAHKQGIVHRDLKPANIFLVPDPEAPAGVRTKVLDFGIAKLVRDRDSQGVNTQSGAVIGTPRYMSPEQCKNAKNVDGRSDIYSLGCILFEMVLGVAPFDYDSWAELVGAHIYEVPPKPSELDAAIPSDVETLIMKMLEKEPNERFSSMTELAESIEVILRAHGAAPMRLTPPGRIVTPPKGIRKVSEGQDPTLPSSTSQEIKAPEVKTATAPTMNAVTPAETSVARPAPARKPPWAAIGIAGAGIGALAVAGVTMVSKREKPPAEEPTYVVVDQRASDDKPVEPAVTKPVDTVVIDAGAAVPPVTAIDAGMVTVKKPPPTDTDVDQLTRTFAGQRTAINACFTKNPTKYEGQLSVRLQIDLKGKVTRAEVVPPNIDATPLGVCIDEVARRTSFGPQPKAAAFKVPLVTLEN